jgi:hypothetical protein
MPRPPTPVPQAQPAPAARVPSASGLRTQPQPAPLPSQGRLEVAQVPASFSVDSALTAVDDANERWLIQKDRLDFGPFTMRDVRAQIEAGKILGDHTIVDTESGERKRVADHPILRPLVLDAQTRLAVAAKEQADAAESRKHKSRVVSLLGVMLLVVLGVGGGVTWYVMNMKPRTERVVVHDGENLDFLKNIEISMKVDPPAPKKPGAHPGKRKLKNGKFDDSMNLGDASEGGGDDTLDQAVVQRVMSQNFRVLVGCISEERRRNASLHTVEMDFLIKGTGQVSSVKVNGQTGTAFAECMYGKMQSVAFPKFNGQKTHASFSLALK